VRFDFKISNAFRFERLANAIGESLRERSLTRAGNTHKKNDSVKGNESATDVGAQSKIQDGLIQQALLDLVLKVNGVPVSGEGRIGELTDCMYSMTCDTEPPGLQSARLLSNGLGSRTTTFADYSLFVAYMIT
jgi:hypothetical protein